jgi:hypothetical protein
MFHISRRRTHLVNVVATPPVGRHAGSERCVPERRTAPWLQRVRIYEIASRLPSHLTAAGPINLRRAVISMNIEDQIIRRPP